MIPFPIGQAPWVVLALALYVWGWWACAGWLHRHLPGARGSEALAGGYLLWQVAIVLTAVLLVYMGLFHTAVFVVVPLVIAAVAWHWGEPVGFARAVGRWFARLPQSQLALLAVAAMGLLTGYLLWFNLHFPADGYDTYGYHRPISVLLLQERTLFDLPSLYPQVNPYPKNGEIVPAWTIAISSWEAPARLLPVFNLVVLLAGLYAILRNWGLARPESLLLAATAPAAPAMMVTIMRDQGDLDINMAACAVLIFAMGSAVLAGRQRPMRYAALAALAGVYLIGLKGSGPIFALLTAVFLAFALRWRGTGWAPIGKLAAAAVVLALVMSSYWIFHNIVRYGNPVYPVTVTAGERVLFEGIAPWEEYIHTPRELEGLGPWEAFRESAEMPLRRHRFYTGDHVGGWGFHFARYAIPAWLLGALLLAVRRRWAPLGLLGLITAWFFATPDFWWARFSLTGIACAPLGVAAVLMALRGRWRGLDPWLPVLPAVWFLSAAMVLSYAVIHTEQYRFTQDIRRAAREEGRRYYIPQDAFRVNMGETDFRLVTRWAAANIPPGNRLGYGPMLEPNLMGLLYRPDYRNAVHQFAPEDFDRFREMDYVLLYRGNPEAEVLEDEGWETAYETPMYVIYRAPG